MNIQNEASALGREKMKTNKIEPGMALNRVSTHPKCVNRHHRVTQLLPKMRTMAKRFHILRFINLASIRRRDRRKEVSMVFKQEICFHQPKTFVGASFHRKVFLSPPRPGASQIGKHEKHFFEIFLSIFFVFVLRRNSLSCFAFV